MKRSALGALALTLLSCGRSEEGANRAAPTSNDQRAKAADQASTLLRPGLWETSVEILKGLSDKIETSEGSYAVTGLVYAPPKLSECLTSERAANPFQRFWFMTGYVDGTKCSYDQFSMAGGKILGKIDCRGSRHGEFALDGQYTSTSYSVVTTTELTGTELGTDFSVRIPLKWKTTAKRTGACPANNKERPPPPPPLRPPSQTPPPPPKD